MIPPRHIVLTLVAGESPEVQRKLAWRMPLPRLSVGTSADWVVTGAGVLGQHLLLSFDGYRLQARAASGTADVRLRGERLDTHWRELGLPFELAFGGARVAGCAVAAAGRSAGSHEAAPEVDPRAATIAQPAQPRAPQAETQLFDLSALRAAALAPHAIVSLGVQASAQAPPARRASGATSLGPATQAPGQTRARGSRRTKSPLPFEVLSSSTLAWSLAGPEPRAEETPQAPDRGGSRAPTLVSSGAPAGALSLAQTISDNGALEAYARRLAAEQRRPSRLAPAAPGQRARRVTGAARQSIVALLSVVEQQRALLSARLRRLSPRERLLALGGSCCVPVLVWLLCAAFLPAGPDTTSDSAASPEAPAPSEPIAPRALEHAEPRPEARPSEAAADGALGGAEAAAAVAPAAENAASETEQSPTLTSAFGKPNPTGDPSRERPSLEQDAYRAAFGGNTSRGVALYEELARERGDEIFRHAARLLQANRVHKP